MMHAGVPALLAAGVCIKSFIKAFIKAFIKSIRSVDTGSLSRLCGAGGDRPHPHLGIRIQAHQTILDSMQNDASGDTLDAVLCAVQAACSIGKPNHGLPVGIDALEGWIVTVPEVKL